MYTILNGSEKIYNKLKKMFNTPDQHGIIITAFVGGDAAEILPQINHNVTLYCWPKAGGTNPDGVIDLLEKGVNIRFVDKLHMKVYWAEGKGAIIGSANLSTNALGGNGLQEVGIYVENFSKEDIKQIVNSLKNVERDQSKINEILKKLEYEHDALPNRIREASKKIMDFSCWYRNYCKGSKRDWKMVWFEIGINKYAKNAVNKAKNEYAVKEPYDAFNFHDDLINEGDWVLLFKIKKEKVVLDRISWLYVDFCVDILPEEEDYHEDYPRSAVQAKLDLTRLPPFKLTQKFKRIFRQAVEQYGSDKIKKADMLVPSKSFLEKLDQLLREKE